MSPELFNPEVFGLQEPRPTRESDCYALGMVIYEVLSGQRPFAATDRSSTALLRVLYGERPARPEGKEGEWFTDCIWQILEHCWRPQPCGRISASAILLHLGKYPPLSMPSSNVDEAVEMGSDTCSESDSDANCTFPHYVPGLSLIPVAPYRTTNCARRQWTLGSTASG